MATRLWPVEVHRGETDAGAGHEPVGVARAERRQRIQQACQEQHFRLGFQADSVQNQVEHVSVLWESFEARSYCPEGYREPDASLWDLWTELLRTQGEWCAKVWQPLTGEADYETTDPLSEICLFMLLWGELGNLRFCPELLCYLFTAARSFCAHSRLVSPKADGTFLNQIVKPIFNVFYHETFEPGDPPKFKFGKAPAPATACNYDDWNELFWDPRRLKRALTLKTTLPTRRPPMLHHVGRPAPDVWIALADVDWAVSLKGQKSHRELHSFFPLLVGCYRVFLLHSIFLAAMLLFWTAQEPWGSWLSRAALGLISPAWITFHFFGFHALTPNLAWCARFLGFLKLILVHWSPIVTFAALYCQLSGLWDTPIDIDFGQPIGVLRVLRPPLKLMLVVHFTLSFFVLFVATSPRTQNLYRWSFYPRSTYSDAIATITFWTVTLGAKYFLDAMVMRYCGFAIDGIWTLQQYNNGPRWLLVAQIAVLVFPACLCFFSSLPSFLNAMVAFVGAARGIKKVGGLRLFCYRRGVGLTRTPENLCEKVLQLPREGRHEGYLFGSTKWWSRLSDRELAAFIGVWNDMVQELRDGDLLSDLEFEALLCDSVEAMRRDRPRVPQLLNPFNVFAIWSALPSNKEAARRIVTLARSVLTEALPSGTVRQMPSLSVIIPHYSETIRFTNSDLFAANGSTDLLRFLVQYYRDEFNHFAERISRSASGAGSSFNSAAFAAASDAPSDLASYRQRRRMIYREVDEELCKWASMRMQTLWRTVEGICDAYSNALSALLEQQEPSLSADCHERLLKDKFQLVLAVQRYAKFADKSGPEYDVVQAAAVEALLSTFGTWLSIAYIEEQVDESGAGKRFYSCLIDSTCPAAADGGMRKPRLRIELPGFPILGNGKSDNQNCALVFTRGEILQVIDANQEAYFESALFLPLALNEFNRTLKGRRPGIVGFRENIFSGVGLPGRLAADSEFAFGTIVQRTMDWPLEARLHYGHPDMMDKLQMLQQGGVSKATRGLNLSEDVFAGIDLTLRGGWTAYREYFHVGKGRDMGFMSVMSFHAKVSMGNGEQAITRQWMRMALGLPLVRLLGIFYTHVGFYLNQCLINWSMKAFAFLVAFFQLSTVVDEGFGGPAALEAANYFGFYYVIFVIASMLPLLFEVFIEKGLKASIRSFASSFFAFSPVFAAFQSKLMAYYFENTVRYGGARYVPTGRGLATTREPFAKIFRCFSPSHTRDAFEAAMYLMIGANLSCGVMLYMCMGLCIISWSIAPFIFNPRQFTSLFAVRDDFHSWMKWMNNIGGSEEQAWSSWAAAQQDVRKNASKLWMFIPSPRLFGAACTLALVSATTPEMPTFMYAALPPVSHAAICFVLVLAGCCRHALPLCGSYAIMAVLASVLTIAEMIVVIEFNQTWSCVLFHKYMCLRFLLEAADGIAAHRPGGCCLSVFHDACRVWALSFRFVRDLILGLALLSFCFCFAMIPGIRCLHMYFLFRARPQREAGHGSMENFSRLLSFSNDREQQDDSDAVLHNFLETFAPQTLRRAASRRPPTDARPQE